MFSFYLYIIILLSVEVGDYEVDGSTGGDEVGNLLSAKHRVESAGQCQTHRTHLHTVRTLVALRVEIYAELAAGSLYREVPLSLGHLDDWLLLNVEVALRNVVDELLDDVKALIELLDVSVVAVH